MGRMVIVAYTPKPGKEGALLQAVRKHSPAPRAEGLVTARPAYAMQAKDGTIAEVFERSAAEAAAKAHGNEAVQALWAQFEGACEIKPLNSLVECGALKLA